MLFVALLIAGLYYVDYLIMQVELGHEREFLDKGILPNVENYLKKYPQVEWNGVLSSIQPKYGAKIRIINIKDAKLSRQEQKKLQRKGAVIKHFGHIRFLGYGLDNGVEYKRIENSSHVIEVSPGVTMLETVNYAMSWMYKLTWLRLNATPHQDWQREMANIRAQYLWPLRLVNKNKERLPQETLQQLKSYPVAYLPPKKGFVYILYFRTPLESTLVKVGPLKYPWVRVHGDLVSNSYLVAVFIIATILLTWAFSRNARKIYKITEEYSRGHFTYQTKFSRFSNLYGVYENVVVMGKNIESLIKTQHNLTRFVAHETRTPLSTMQFSLDVLKEEKPLSPTAKDKIVSMQEDINDLNTLTRYFILYSQSATQELRISKEPVCLYTWLENIVKRYQTPTIKVALTVLGSKESVVAIDPRLFKHVIDNLLTNAIKFARREVAVSISYLENTVIIKVDDDGEGIPKAERKTIFEPFATLDSAGDMGKHIGLGLAIVKAIVDLHGGRVTVAESSLLGGAQFRVEL